jgi:RND family efflux transporter MFP subunit
MRKSIIVVVIVALLAGGYFAWSKLSKREKPKEAPATGAVERGPLRMVVSSSGKVVSNLDVEIKCKASGEIIRIPFDVSDAVKKGALLLELNPLEMQRQVDQAKAVLASSNAKLINARENLAIATQTLETDRRKTESALRAAEVRSADARTKAERVKELLDRKLSSQEEYDTAATAAAQAGSDTEQTRLRLDELKTQERSLELSRQQIRMAEAQVLGDTLALDLANERLGDTKVTSPIDGVVTARSVQIGQIISSGISNVGGGTTALTVSDLSRIFILGAVDEADIGKVATSQPVEITVDAFPGKRFAGRVERIATRGVNVSNVVTFEVKIEVVSKEKSLLRPEMTANVEIIAAARENVLSVPTEAIVRKEGKPNVTVVAADGSQADRVVEVGITDGLRTEIPSGVAEGEKVVIHKGSGSKFNGGFRGPPMMFR